MNESAVATAKDLARNLGWEEWKAGRTNNALELWEASDISLAATRRS